MGKAKAIAQAVKKLGNTVVIAGRSKEKLAAAHKIWKGRKLTQ